MATSQKVDRRLLEELEGSLAAVIGEGGAKAVVKLAGIPEDKFDPRAINKSLNKVFGPSKEGLSIIQSNILQGMSSRLNPGVEEGPQAAKSFVKSLDSLAERYRLGEKAGLATAGLAAGMLSSICCLGPIAFALLGFASLSASLPLAMDLTSRFRPVELGASIGLLAVTIFFQLKRHNECNLSGLRRNIAYVAIPGSAVLVTYAVVNYLLGAYFFGGGGSLFP